MKLELLVVLSSVLLSLCEEWPTSSVYEVREPDCRTTNTKEYPLQPTTTCPPYGPMTVSCIGCNKAIPKAGELKCNFWSRATVDSFPEQGDCHSFCEFNRITFREFFKLNPVIEPDCSGFHIGTEYCVKGYIVPSTNDNGTCGPLYGDAGCPRDGKRCCNSKTWRCGSNFIEDCSPPICYGDCPSVDIFTRNGECDEQSGWKVCYGRYGNCCSIEKGRCGSGPEFCGVGKCQSGACDEYKDK